MTRTTGNHLWQWKITFLKQLSSTVIIIGRYWGPNKLADSLQTTFSGSFQWMCIYHILINEFISIWMDGWMDKRLLQKVKLLKVSMHSADIDCLNDTRNENGIHRCWSMLRNNISWDANRQTHVCYIEYVLCTFYGCFSNEKFYTKSSIFCWHFSLPCTDKTVSIYVIAAKRLPTTVLFIWMWAIYSYSPMLLHCHWNNDCRSSKEVTLNDVPSIF